MSCIVTRQAHQLVEMMRKPAHVMPDAEQVVRWCKDCGSVVIDIDADGRTVHPGGIVEMGFPILAKQAQFRADYNIILGARS
jgi:hypothetical protein